jgi:hypothetical protein
MVDIRSTASSSHPFGHGQGSEQEVTSCSRAGQSHQMNARNATTVVMPTAAAAQRQHSAAMAVVMPPSASPEATLEAAHALIHNPLGLHASPSAAKQWHHDIDQLIVAAINTPPRGGW